MDEIIKRAINTLDQLLESSHESTSELIKIRNLLSRLTDPNLPRNEWTELFCRRLDKLLHFNDHSPSSWIDMHDDILYILEGSNDEQGVGTKWNRYVKTIAFEKNQQQRELQFQQKFGKRKSLKEFFHQHPKFFKEYLRQSISFHSKIQIQSLIKSFNDFLSTNLCLIETSSIGKNQKYLEAKLKSIDVPFDCSNISLININEQFSTHDDPHWTTKHNFNNFIPSIKTHPTIYTGTNKSTIAHILHNHRWVIILGDPGSGKTTLLRWIMHLFAEAADRNDEEVILDKSDKYYRSTIRIPILIRLGEFAAWLNQNPNKTLIDYVGKHTWFSQFYTNDGNILQELIFHGHALILLDGLDEIIDFRQRREIVDHVKKFIDEHVRTLDFCSAFDDNKYDTNTYIAKLSSEENFSQFLFDGNQIIVTSRFVGYEFYPILGPSINHYLLSLMEYEEAQEFINQWISKVKKRIYNVLSNEGIKLNRKKMKLLSAKRYNTTQAMFKKTSELLQSNPSLLSLIGTLSFQSFNEFYPQTRVEIYNHVVQFVLQSWIIQQPNISKDIIINFLINLATYIHMSSPSGLIDTFDMKHLCCLILKQQHVSKKFFEIHEYADKITSILQSNMGIVAELGLEVFAFQHLSFQEYFVSQNFVKDSSVEEVAKRIHTFVINIRFRESILLAIGWISWQWSLDDYNKFCNLLITYDKNYGIPLGILIFFDAIKDLKRLPSKLIIFNALNSLLDYPVTIIVERYLIRNLITLPEDIIIEWMQLHLKDEKYLAKFCCCLSKLHNEIIRKDQINKNSILFVIYKQVISFHTISTTAEFIIDQTLQSKIIFEKSLNHNLTNKLSSYFQSENICASNIHPLILSVILLIYGGIYDKYEIDTSTLCFSPKQMYRQSSITSSIIKYLSNHKDSHSVKVKSLIKHYENILQTASPFDTSTNIIDTFLVFICLNGLSKPIIYKKYRGYHALLLALKRLKQVWFYLTKLRIFKDSFYLQSMESLIKSKDKVTTKVFRSQSISSNKECLRFSLACVSALEKLHIEDSSSLAMQNLPYIMNLYLGWQPEFRHADNKRKFDQMLENIHPMQIIQHTPYFLLSLIPQYLQNLYYCTVIRSFNPQDSLPMVVLLSECLIFLENVDSSDLNFYLALSMLQSQLKEHKLENYASILIWKNSSYEWKREELFILMKNHVIWDQLFNEHSKDWKILIEMERQRIYNIKNILDNREKDLQLFAASITLARLFQVQYGIQSTEYISLSIVESTELHVAVNSIVDPVLRIIAFSIILDMKDPLIFGEEQRDCLRLEMIDSLQSMLPQLPLLTATLLFVRYHSIHHLFPVHFQHMANIITKKFNTNSDYQSSHSEEAAIIALNQINNPDVLPCLLQFTKRNKNLSDLLQFNSTIFHRYFINTTSFDLSHTVLLSIMYLIELTSDAQILQIYTNDNQKRKISLLKELDQLWNDVSKNKKIMSYTVATWITNNLQLLNKQELYELIINVSKCLLIERKALSVIDKWLSHRMNKDLRYFAYYAALQLLADGSNLPDLIDIINEMLHIDKEYHFISLVERCFKSESVILSNLQSLFKILHHNVHYSRKISLWINCQEILDLILILEYERVQSNLEKSSSISMIPYLLMIKGCSYNLQLYFIEYIQTFINDEIGTTNTFKEEYIAVLIKWIIESSIWINTEENFSEDLYYYIFTLLHNHHFPQVQKAIINSFNLVFFRYNGDDEYRFFEHDDTIAQLEEIIYAWNKYSDDVLAVCLLAYGNGQLKLKKFQDQTILNVIHSSLNNIIEAKSSEIIIIRAIFCLIVIEQSFVTDHTLSHLFRQKSSLTPENRYKMLLQRTLFYREYPYVDDEEKPVDHIVKYLDELLNIFILDLQNYLYDKSNNNYLSDPTPNYVQIACDAMKKYFNIFHKPIQKNIFDDQNLKEESYRYLYYAENASPCAALIELYTMCGVLTVELIEMWEWLEDVYPDHRLWMLFKFIKQVSDQRAIEKLLQLLHSMMYNRKLAFCDQLLILLNQLAQDHLISSYEFHHQIAITFKDLSHVIDNAEWKYESEMFSDLLGGTCIERVPSHYYIGGGLYTETHIDEEFEKRNQNLQNISALFLRRNFFFDILHLISNGFNKTAH